MKKLVFVLVTAFLFGGFAMAQSTKVIKCRTKGCSNLNKVSLICYGSNNKAVENNFNASTIKIVGVDIYNEPLNDGNIKRNVVLGPQIVEQVKNIKTSSFLDICKDVEIFCNTNKIQTRDDGNCKLARMMFYISTNEQICDASDLAKSNCL
jgi:hypothetical protein